MVIEGYHDPGDNIEINMEEPIQDGRYFISEKLSFKNPLPPSKQLRVKTKLDFIGASANRIFINLSYLDSDIKIYCKSKKFYYTVIDGNVEEILDADRERLIDLIKRETKITKSNRKTRKN